MSKPRKQRQARPRTQGVAAVGRPPEPGPQVRPFSYTVDAEGNVSVTLAGRLPTPTLVGNKKWPWSKWQVGYTTKTLERDVLRVLQTISNLRLVTATVEAREATKAARPAPVESQQQASTAGVQ